MALVRGLDPAPTGLQGLLAGIQGALGLGLPLLPGVQIGLEILHPALGLADGFLQGGQIRLPPGDIRLEGRLAPRGSDTAW